MRTLIAILGTGKGTWGHVKHLSEDEKWDKIIYITSDFGKENFDAPENAEWILINPRMGINLLIDQISQELNPEGDVFVNIISGQGREHMALLTVLKKKNIQYKFAVITNEGIQYF